MKKINSIILAITALILSTACSLSQMDENTHQKASALYTINGYAANYEQVYLRGTFNGWDKTAMTLTSDNSWSADVTFGDSASESFKFDIFGDWSVNFGDNDGDHRYEQNGENISVTPGKTYTINFNDYNGYYYIYEKTWNAKISLSLPAGLSASDFSGLKTWKYQDSEKIGWNYIYTDTDSASSPVSGLKKGVYTITFDDVVAGKRYTGSVDITIDGSVDTVNETMLITESDLSDFGSVDVKVYFDRYENGNITSSPVYGVGIYLGDWHAGYSLGTTDSDGSALVTVQQGIQDFSVFKMTSSHSIMSKYISDVTVVANQTNDLEIHTAPYSVSVSAYADAGFGNALYITGASDYLGNWTEAYKMHYDNSRGCWAFSKALPVGLPFKIVKAAWVDGDSISTTSVQWENGGDRIVPKPSYIDISIVANPQF